MIRKLIKNVIIIFGYCNYNLAVEKYRVPFSVLTESIEEKKIQILKIFGLKLIKLKSLKKFINNDLKYKVFDIKNDDFQFKMTFNDYPIDLPIFERINGGGSISETSNELLETIKHKLKNNEAAIKGLKKLNIKLFSNDRNHSHWKSSIEILESIWTVVFNYNEQELISLDVNDYNPDLMEEDYVYDIFKFLDKQ